MANTTNFGWETPDDTDLVKDGALAMRTLGNAIDTSLVDLKGGTTGQVLSKTSNTDMDFTWVTTDDADAIQNSIVDAKGDLIAATADNTPARLAVGNPGETLVADSSTSTGLRWQGNFAAGKNKILNSDCSIWQRGTSINFASDGQYYFDRFAIFTNGSGRTSLNVSRQSFTPGAAPVAGIEYPYFARLTQSTAGTGGTYNSLLQWIEGVENFAGQTVTFSFYAKASGSLTLPGADLEQNFGSGGSGAVTTSVASNISLTTSWQRFTYTLSVPSISGKTVGSNSKLGYIIKLPLNSTYTIDLFGFQLEAGNTATAFQTATGTLAGELSLAQRYYQRSAGGIGQAAGSTTVITMMFPLVTEMRTAPSATLLSGTAAVTLLGTGNQNVSSISTNASSTRAMQLLLNGSGYTSNGIYSATQTDKIEFSAEL